MPESEYDKLRWWEKPYWYVEKMLPLLFALLPVYFVIQLRFNTVMRRAFWESLPRFYPLIFFATALLVIRIYRPWREQWDARMQASLLLRTLFLFIVLVVICPIFFSAPLDYFSWLEKHYSVERQGIAQAGNPPSLFPSLGEFIRWGMWFCGMFALEMESSRQNKRREASKSAS
jgi:hypothetical protein